MSTCQAVKCRCRNCDGHIEFDPSAVGQTVTCPHCGMDTALYIPSAATTPASAPRSNWGRIVLLVIAGAFGVALLIGLVHSLATSEAAQKAAVTLGGGALAIVICGVLLLIALLWVLFPVFVYFSLERMKKALDQIELNTRNH